MIEVADEVVAEPGETLEAEVGQEPQPAPARTTSSSATPNPMVKVYLAALGVAALALIAGILALIKLPPRYIEVEVAAVEQPVVADPNEPAPEVAVLPPLDPVSNEVARIGPAPSTNLITDDAVAVVSAEEEARLRQMQEDERARDEVQALYDFSVKTCSNPRRISIRISKRSVACKRKLSAWPWRSCRSLPARKLTA